jgi:hypothetical protein
MASPLDPAAAADALKKFLADMAQATVQAMRNTAIEAGAHAHRQSAIADRLADTAGQDDARVVKLRETSESSRRLAQTLNRTASRLSTDGVPRPRGFTFTGRVTDATGAIVPGATVRLADPAGAIKVAGSAVTDESGQFTLVVPAKAVDPNAADLSLIVDDAGNAVANASRVPVEIKPGVLMRVDLIGRAPARPSGVATARRVPAGGGRRKSADRRKNPPA